ncbi:hypothetical protein ACFXHA_00835 [Nocardia sp. NPDC059240]|uniref:hypothetical protein n=1 Tax=Nocardia sp. NPDC059240 TaxID=3346786 RepID=UPI0036D1B79C
MTVQEYDEIDLAAVGADGQMVLNMREDRTSDEVDPAVLREDFRRKLAAYVHAIRSGYARDLAARQGHGEITGYRIELSSWEQPDAEVMALLESVGSAVPEVPVTGGWVDLGNVSLEVVENALVTAVTESVPPGWKSLRLWVVAVGEFGYGQIEAKYGLLKTRQFDISENLWAFLAEHKRRSYDEHAGAWLSGQILVDRNDTQVNFRKNDVAGDFPVIDPAEWRREFELYPRAAGQIPEAIRNADGSTLMLRPILADGPIRTAHAKPESEDETLELDMLKVVMPMLPGGWTFVMVWFSMVGGEGHAGISVMIDEKTVQNLNPPQELLGVLTASKEAAYDPIRGTWFSGKLEFRPDSTYRSTFSNSETPEWVPAPTVEEYRREFTSYPRDPAEIPAHIRDLLT